MVSFFSFNCSTFSIFIVLGYMIAHLEGCVNFQDIEHHLQQNVHHRSIKLWSISTFWSKEQDQKNRQNL